MIIKSLYIKNFLSFGNTPHEINFERGLTAIVGPNDSGKTSLFRAINFISEILNDSWRKEGFASFASSYFHEGKRENPIEVQASVQFDEGELDAIANFLICSSLLIISQHNEDVKQYEKELIMRYGRQVFRQLLDNVVTIGIKVEYRRLYPITAYLKIKGPRNQELYIHGYGTISKRPVRLTSYSPKSLVDILIADMPTNSSKTVAIDNYTPSNIFDSITRILTEDTKAPVVIDIQGFQFQDIENRIEHILRIESLNEGHSFERFMLDRGFDKEGANLFEVISTIYDDSFVRTANTRCLPRKTLLEEIPSESIDSIELMPDDLPRILFDLKNSTDTKRRNAYTRINEELFKAINVHFEVIAQEETIEREQEEFTLFHPQSNTLGGYTDIRGIGIRPKRTNEIEHELIICFLKNDLIIPLHLAAAGMFETLYLLTAIIAPIGKVVLLDEPALNLHPNLQSRILYTINDYSIQKNSNQVILITHSPFMLDAANLRAVYRLDKKGDSTTITNFQNVANSFEDEDRKQLSKWLKDAEIRSLLFSRGIVLVEGISDKLVIEIVDKHLSLDGRGADIQNKEIVVIDVGGKKSMRIFLKLARDFGIPYVVVVDSDAILKCEGKIEYGSKTILTSPLFVAFGQANILKDEDLSVLDNIARNGGIVSKVDEANGKEYWYAETEEIVNTIRAIAKKYNGFVLAGTLEDALQIKQHRRRKPIASVDAILERIANGAVPEEFQSLINFIKVVCNNR